MLHTIRSLETIQKWSNFSRCIRSLETIQKWSHFSRFIRSLETIQKWSHFSRCYFCSFCGCICFFFKSFLLDLNYHLDSASHSRYFLPFRTFVTLCRPDHSQNHLRKSICRYFVIHMFALNNNTANLAKMAKFPFRWLGWLTQVLQICKNQKN